MKYELEKSNNSKKLIIGVSILFCTIILVIGATTAFFTQSDNSELGNIVTTDIDGTLLYRDDYEENNLYNRQGLIPASLDVVLNTYKRVDTENKCLAQNNYAACSVYRFSIKNNSNVSQELIMNLNPTANSYNNLKYLFFELKDSNILQLSENPVPLENGKYDSIPLVENFTLTPNEERVYELVFYVENQNYAQDDAGKTFGAGISINSITTGAYVNKQYGTTCWNVDQTDPTKLISFNGILDDGSIDESCTGYVDVIETKDNVNYYSVTIPSTFGGNDIKTIGNMLLNVVSKDINGNIIGLNNNVNINEIIIQEGIEVIEDGNISTQTGAFIGIGGDMANQKPDPNRTLKITLPSTLTHIGASAFPFAALREITIPENVQELGDFSFHTTSNLTKVKLNNNLKTIGQSAFGYSNITTTADTPLIIPASVTTIKSNAFANNSKLTKVIFEDSENNPSYLNTIEDYAFSDCDLTYPETSPLLIPSSVEEIQEYGFYNDGVDSNTKLEAITFGGDTSKFSLSWYNSALTKLNP